MSSCYRSVVLNDNIDKKDGGCARAEVDYRRQ